MQRSKWLALLLVMTGCVTTPPTRNPFSTTNLRNPKPTDVAIYTVNRTQRRCSVVINGQQYNLALVEHSVRSPNYKVYSGRNDLIVRTNITRPTTYRGTVIGKPDSAVAASIDFQNKSLFARIFMDGKYYVVQPATHVAINSEMRHRMDQTRKHITFEEDDTTFVEFTDIAVPIPEVISIQSGGPCDGADICEAEIAFDADYEFYQHWGTIGGVEERINDIVNGINIQYERDVGIRHVISHIIVRTQPNDPYTLSNPNELLVQFRDHWRNNHDDVPRSTAVLLTGRELDGSTIGIAYVGVICNEPWAFGVMEANFSGTFNYVTDLFAHELGHNWNANHCDCANPAYTMNPSLKGANSFHPSETIPEIYAFRNSRNCVQPVGVECTVDADCSDDNICNGDEVCLAGQCVPGIPLSCDDNDPCTTDDCQQNGCVNMSIEGCESPPNEAECGNRICEPESGESCLSCPKDCNGKQVGPVSKRFCCGCGEGYNPVDCSDPRCSAKNLQCE